MQRFEDQFEFIWGEKFLPFQSTPPTTMPQDYKPKSHAQALALALLLAVTASTDDKAAEAQTLATNIASQMNDETQFNAVRDSVSACLAYFTDNMAHLEVGA